MRLNCSYNRNWARNAKKTRVGDEIYDSKFEASYAQELHFRKAAGEIKDFTPHPKLDLEVNGFNVCSYTPDFLITHNDGSLEYVECKGFPAEIFKLRWKLFYALFFDKAKLTIVQQGCFKINNPKKCVPRKNK